MGHFDLEGCTFIHFVGRITWIWRAVGWKLDTLEGFHTFVKFKFLFFNEEQVLHAKAFQMILSCNP